jgi:hypothetical protein
MVITDQITILDTMELVVDFEQKLGYELTPEDRLEIFHQIFLMINQHSALDLDDKDVLDYDSLVFANYLNVDHAAVDRIAYNLMVKVWHLCHQRGFYINGELRYMPFAMHGWDLSVRYYQN